MIVFSYTGYLSKEVLVNESRTINVTLQKDDKLLDEVVVIGYGVVKKSDLTSSISTVKGSDLKTTTTGNAMLSIQGKTNGVQITAGGGPGAAPPGIYTRSNNCQRFRSFIRCRRFPHIRQYQFPQPG